MKEEIIRDWEGWAAIVTVVGLPFAIAVFLVERRKERQADQEGLYQQVSDSYRGFLQLVLENSDLGLLRPPHLPAHPLDEEQRQRQFVLFGLLISIFEQAYILVYEDRMDRQTARLWQSWEDYMREWCHRREFRDALPELLPGEDPEFVAYLRRIAAEENGS
jgi:hypothetical protein